MGDSRHTYALSDFYYLGVLLMLGACSYSAMLDIDNQANEGSGLSFLAMVGLAAIQLPLLIFVFGQRLKNQTASIRLIPRFILLYIIYFIWMTTITVLADDEHNIMGLTTMSLSILVFPALLGTSYFRARYSELDTWFFMAVIFIMLCIAIAYKNIYSIANFIDLDKGHIGVSYFPLFVLPILLLSPSRVVRYASVIITSIIIISAIKRGGILALGISLLIYVLIKQRVSGTSKLRQIIIILAIVAAMGGVVYYLMEETDNDIIERIQNISDDGGSGRDILWADTYHNIQNRDIGYQLVGNGYRSAQKVSVLRLPAHNDFLEIWYDFGFIGIVLYGVALLSLCLYELHLIKRKSQYAPHMAMILVYFFIFSMVSIVILYPLMALLVFTIGIIAGLADRELENNTNQIKIHEK